MGIGGTHRLRALRAIAATLLACLTLPLAAQASPASSDPSSDVSSVSIQLPSRDVTTDGWAKPPLIAQLIPQGPGVMYYRIGAGPGPWTQVLGPVVVPPGKQLLSAVLVAPDGNAGNVTTVVARSDVHALTPSSLTAVNPGRSTSTYSGVPGTGGGVTVSVLVGRQLGTIVRRIGGSDRYYTSALISSSVPGHSKTVIIATGQKFPDALTASGLAGCLNASVLLVTRDHIPPATAKEIRRLGAKRAIICGGTPSVSKNVESKLRSMGLSTERLAGKTRYETAIVVSQRIQKLTGNRSRVFLARGDRFADALITAPLAYRTKTPILLSGTDKLWDTTARRIGTYGYATLVGDGLSARVEDGVRHRVGRVDRWAGSGPSDTSVQVALDAVNSGALSWKYVGVARSDIFPDALCGGALAGKQGGVILLTPSGALAPSVAGAMTAHTADVQRCEVFGQASAISQPVFDQISSIFH